MQVIALEIDNFYIPTLNLPKGIAYYGNENLDLGVIELKSVKNLPVASIYEGAYAEGELIATSGFPTGDDILKVPGWIHQLGPTLRTGVISAVLPFNCSSPHALLLDVMLQGGASGSPVFLPHNNQVVGIIDSGLPGTNFSFCIPSWFIKHVLDAINQRPELKERAKNKIPISEWIKSKKVWQQTPKTGLTSDNVKIK